MPGNFNIFRSQESEGQEPEVRGRESVISGQQSGVRAESELLTGKALGQRAPTPHVTPDPLRPNLLTHAPWLTPLLPSFEKRPHHFWEIAMPRCACFDFHFERQYTAGHRERK
jgi:hypothetical protein